MIFSHFTLSRQVLSESYTFCAIRDNWKFAFSTVTSFPRQKPLKCKNKNDTIVWNKKFYHCAKFELYRIKDAKVFPSVQLRALCWPGVFWSFWFRCQLVVLSDCRIRCLLEFVFVWAFPAGIRCVWLLLKSIFLDQLDRSKIVNLV